MFINHSYWHPRMNGGESQDKLLSKWLTYCDQLNLLTMAIYPITSSTLNLIMCLIFIIINFCYFRAVQNSVIAKPLLLVAHILAIKKIKNGVNSNHFILQGLR